MNALGPEEILAILPHRYQFLLVDRIQEIVCNEYAIGLKNVTLNEPFFQGHFPYYRVMPGVLVIEAMAQVGGVLVYYSDTVALGKTPLFTGIDRGKFRRQVTGRSTHYAPGGYPSAWASLACTRPGVCGQGPGG